MSGDDRLFFNDFRPELRANDELAGFVNLPHERISSVPSGQFIVTPVSVSASAPATSGEELVAWSDLLLE